MTELKEKGKYEITEEMKKRLDILYGDFSDEDDTLKAIEKVYESSDYLIDTHTAVAYDVYEKYKNKTGDNSATIIASTASPFKFPKSINEVLDMGHENASDFELVNLFSDKLNLKLPKGLEGLEEKEICHKVTCKKDEMKKVIKNF